MNNKKLLQQILKIDNKADLIHEHNQYLETADLPNGGYISIEVKAKDWAISENGLYTAVIRHQLGTTSIIAEAVSAEGSLLVIGYDTKGENIVELSSEEAVDMTVTIIHRTEAHTAVGYNPINDENINSFQTWSSEKINNTIRDITGAIDMSMLATKEEVEEQVNLLTTKTEFQNTVDTLATKIEVQDQLTLKANTLDVNNLLDTKANTIDVNSKLDLKADKATIEQQITTLATKTEVEEQMELKANKDEVTSQINTLATKEELQSKVDTLVTTEVFEREINLKANAQEVEEQVSLLAKKSDIESQMALKADKQEIQNQMSLKADKQELTTLATKVDVDNKLNLKADKETMDSQIATLATKVEVEEQVNLLATKEEVEEDLVANLQASKDYTNQAIAALPEADVTKAYVDAQLETKMDIGGCATQDIAVKNITINGAIIPGAAGLTIGTQENRFEGIYVDEAYLSTNTLYIGDTPILGTSQDTIMIKADPDQSITMKTSATGTTKVISESGVELSTSGMNANVVMQATGTNSQVNIASTGNTTISAPVLQVNADTTNTKDLNITGNLSVTGDKSILQCRAVEIKDNMIDINYGEVGNGVTSGVSGLRVIRGEEDPFLILFDETDDKLKTGFGTSSLKALALEEQIDLVKQQAIEYTDNAIGDLMGTAPEALNTLQELAQALGNDSNFSATVTTQIGLKADSSYVNTELAKKSDLVYVQNELTKKADATHNHNDMYFTKDEINAMMENLVSFEVVGSAYTLRSAQETNKEMYVEDLLKELETERAARKKLESRLNKLEKAMKLK